MNKRHTTISPAALRRQIDDGMDVYQPRSYLGMSHIADCPRSLYRFMKNGSRPPSLTTARYCHEGLLHEADIIDRMRIAGVVVEDCQRELVAPFDERFRGHIDGAIGDLLIEIKSISANDRLDRIKRDGPMPAHLWQVQAYMRYGGYDLAYVVYKVRATGSLWIVPVPIEHSIGRRIESQAQRILDAVDGRGPVPDCTCGRCSQVIR